MCMKCQKPARGLSRRTLLAVAASSAALVCAGVSARAAAPVLELPKPKPMDACPVCGMLVQPYPYWTATVLFSDGHADHFDGAKDFFKYLHDMPKYARGRTREAIRAMGVTGYYAPELIAARDALYVVGSDVLGPMGHELVPQADTADAEEFMKDHKGRRVLRFDEVKPPLLAALDDGRFE